MTLKQFHSHSKPKSKPVFSFKPDQFPVLVHWATQKDLLYHRGGKGRVRGRRAPFDGSDIILTVKQQ